MQHGAAEFGMRRFVGMVHPLNGASERVLQKLGLVFDRDLPPEDDGTAFRLYATPATGPQDGYRPGGRS
jgi:RimJ/RimL family protein N-acetyltransferase